MLKLFAFIVAIVKGIGELFHAVFLALKGLLLTAKVVWLSALTIKLVSLIDFATLPEVILASVLGFLFSVALLGTSFLAHAGIGLLLRRTKYTFVSFQHDLENKIVALVNRLNQSGLELRRLPFVPGIDHDALLDRVRDSIRRCTVFLCVPGARPSFVESEVLMAFGLNKPLLFVVHEREVGRIPNTAKKGYPIFTAERLDTHGLDILARFCSYLAADLRSTFDIAKAALFNVRLLLGGYLVVYAFSVILFAWVFPDFVAKISASENLSFLQWLTTALTNPAVLWFAILHSILLLIPYTLYLGRRFSTRLKLKRAISGQRFSPDELPEKLAYALARADLRKILYRGELRAEHEAEQELERDVHVARNMT